MQESSNYVKVFLLNPRLTSPDRSLECMEKIRWVWFLHRPFVCHEYSSSSHSAWREKRLPNFHWYFGSSPKVTSNFYPYVNRLHLSEEYPQACSYLWYHVIQVKYGEISPHDPKYSNTQPLEPSPSDSKVKIVIVAV